MPIHRTLNLRSVTDAEFEAIDAAVMRSAYAIQNRLGRLFDERVYENALAAQLRDAGFEVHTQVPLHLSHGSFRKTFYLDLVVNEMIYELKAVAALNPAHDSQALQYAMLQDISRVKLLNFGEAKVRGKLLRNAISGPARFEPRLRKSGWDARTPACEDLFNHLRSLLADWGTHLSSQLYTEALVHHFGGEAHCLSRMDVTAGALKLGTHLIQHHAPGHGFFLTTMTRDQTAFQRNLQTLLRHVRLEAIQWINLNHSRVEITTIEGKDSAAKE